MELKETMSSEEAAKVLPYSVEHINLLCRQGKIRAKKPFGRWSIDASHVRELAGVDDFKVEKEASKKEIVEKEALETVGERHDEQPKGVELDI